MVSVTQRIREIKQPYGGYLKPSLLNKTILDDGVILHEKENIAPNIIGSVVDYLCRFEINRDVEKAFDICIKGYMMRKAFVSDYRLRKDKKTKVDIESLLKKIQGLDDDSIIAACRLCSYDDWFRNITAALHAPYADEINPDNDTIENVRVMVQRCKAIFETYGYLVEYEITFEEGYTDIVTHGDGDFITEDTLWDMKVTKNKILPKHTLQILMYWIMGQHSNKAEFKSIDKIGIINPRLNTVYTYPIEDIEPDTIHAIEKDVIGYGEMLPDDILEKNREFLISRHFKKTILEKIKRLFK